MPQTRIGGALKLMLLLGLEVAFIAVFHALGNVQNMGIDFGNFKQWIDVTPPEVALVASIRLLALVFSYWLLATSVIYMIARALHMTKLLRGLELITLPGVRRTIDAGLAATIIGGTVFGGAGAVFANTSHSAQAQGAPAAVTAQYQDLRVLYNPTPAGGEATPTTQAPVIPTDQSVDNPKVVVNNAQATETPNVTPSAPPVTPSDVAPVQDDRGNYIPQPAEQTTTPSSTTPDTTPKVVVTTPSGSETTTTNPKVVVPPTTAPVTTPIVDIAGKQVQQPNDVPAAPTPTTPGSYTVVPGDNFWAIAKTQVQNSLGREPTNAEVASYWVVLIDANKASIRSGDPDLIFPGEVFTLPPL